jgi:hypothetical protein
MVSLEIVDDKHIKTYLLNENITKTELNNIAKHIIYRHNIKELRFNGIKWIKKMHLDIWNDKLEHKIKSLSIGYANRNILESDIFWIECKKMPYDLHNSLTLELHITRAMTYVEYREKYILETMTRVITNDELINIIENIENIL